MLDNLSIVLLTYVYILELLSAYQNKKLAVEYVPVTRQVR